MKKLVVIALLFTFLAACGNEGRKGNTSLMSQPAGQLEAARHEYVGTYKGKLPCADCDGIEVTLKIREDGEFRLKTCHKASRHGQEDIHAEYEGDYSWNSAEGVITLRNINTQPNKYMLRDGNLVQLDINGNIIEGPLSHMYILRRT